MDTRGQKGLQLARRFHGRWQRLAISRPPSALRNRQRPSDAVDRLRRLSICALFALACSFIVAPPVAEAAPQTIVSFTFDDGHWSHYSNAAPILQSHRMRGTFYLNSGHISTRAECAKVWCWHMAWEDAAEMHAAGHDMGGHTLHHVNLTDSSLTTQQKRTEVCDDRQNLISRGFSPVSFAYPYSAYDSTAKTIVRDCGYSSARAVGGLPRGTYAESLPPPDPYATRTPSQPDNTLSTLQNMVTQAESNGGGWVQVVFHEVCDCPDAPSRVTPATLDAFAAWLAPRAANGTVVKTVREAIGGDLTPPNTSISCNGSACSTASYTAPVSVALSASDSGSGVDVTRYTTDGTEPTATNGTVYSAPFSVSQTTTVKFRSWDKAGNVEPTRTQLIQVDKAPPSIVITSPSDGSSVSGRVEIMADARDGETGLREVRFYVDGALLATDQSAPYRTIWNTRRAAKGQHTVSAVAVDAAGNSATSAVTVNVT